MKTAILNLRVATVILIAFFSTAFTEAPNPTAKESAIEVKFLNKVKKQPLFQLNVNNAEAGDYIINIEDGLNNMLYKENLKGKMISRKYLVDVPEEEFNDPNFALVFEIVNIKTNKRFVYNVTRQTKFLEEILVAKL